jgi:hypothetical protein
LQPLLVSRIEQTPYYRLEDGLRRFSAVRALLREGFSIPTVPVRILPAPLTALERLALLFSEGKPLEALEEAEIIDKLLSQGLSEENLLQAFNRSWEELERRRSLLRLGKTLRQQLRRGIWLRKLSRDFGKIIPSKMAGCPNRLWRMPKRILNVPRPAREQGRPRWRNLKLGHGWGRRRTKAFLRPGWAIYLSRAIIISVWADYMSGWVQNRLKNTDTPEKWLES